MMRLVAIEITQDGNLDIRTIGAKMSIKGADSMMKTKMTTVRKTITLTRQQDAWVKSQVEIGAYANDSEIIRDLIRREQERTAEIETLRAALIEAENSGKPQNFDPEAFKRRMQKAHG